MQYTVLAPSEIRYRAALPASKSISNRALAISALIDPASAPGSSIANLSACDDTAVMLSALRELPPVIDIHGAGTAMRFLTAVLSTREGVHVLTGSERMRHRPIGVLVEALRTLGADIEYTELAGYPPLRISGRQLEGGALTVEAGTSSQYISALLMIGPVLRQGLTLHLAGVPASRPYIDLTICTMQEFGADVEWVDASTIHVGAKPYTPQPFTVENDWSAASYWYEMLALTGRGEVRLPHLQDGSRQGDSAVRYIYSMLGVRTAFAGDVVLTAHRRALPRLDFDFSGVPDLAQTVVVTTALMGLPFRFTGLQTLRIKETDRIAALVTEMYKLGFVLDDTVEGVLAWDGTRCKPMAEPTIDTYDDHRMALAFAPAAIKFPGLRINDPGVVSKSYPDYWDELQRAGFKIGKQ